MTYLTDLIPPHEKKTDCIFGGYLFSFSVVRKGFKQCQMKSERWAKFLWPPQSILTLVVTFVSSTASGLKDGKILSVILFRFQKFDGYCVE